VVMELDEVSLELSGGRQPSPACPAPLPAPRLRQRAHTQRGRPGATRGAAAGRVLLHLRAARARRRRRAQRRRQVLLRQTPRRCPLSPRPARRSPTAAATAASGSPRVGLRDDGFCARSAGKMAASAGEIKTGETVIIGHYEQQARPRPPARAPRPAPRATHSAPPPARCSRGVDTQWRGSGVSRARLTGAAGAAGRGWTRPRT